MQLAGNELATFPGIHPNSLKKKKFVNVIPGPEISSTVTNGKFKEPERWKNLQLSSHLTLNIMDEGAETLIHSFSITL